MTRAAQGRYDRLTGRAMTDIRTRPNTIPWPPILFIGTLVVAKILGAVAPLGFPPGDLGQLTGWIIVTLAVMLMAWSFLAFRAARANILPHKAADTVIASGPFRLSRNPIYLSEAVLLAGLGFVNGSLWYWLLIPPFMVAVTRLGILREEAHMAAKFGQAWTDYASAVRRWL